MIKIIHKRSGHGSGTSSHCPATSAPSVNLYVPRDDSWIRGFPPDQIPEAAWFLNLLHWKWICWRADPDGFVRLKTRYLRRVVSDKSLGEIRKTLSDSGVIDWDRSFVPGIRCMRYRVREPYQHTKLLLCDDHSVVRKVQKLDRELVLLPVHSWLKAQLRLLEFDRSKAETIIAGMMPDDDSPLDVAAYQTLLLNQVQRLDTQQQSGTPELTPCPYGRVHTAVTRLPKTLRQCLTLQGEPVVSIDLCNSQPLFAGMVAREFYQSRSKRQRLREFTILNSRQLYGRRVRNPTPTIHTTTKDTPITIREKPYLAENKGGYKKRLCDASDFLAYMAACERGQFYESVRQTGEDRRYIKRRCLIDFFYGKPSYQSPIKDRIEEKYPTIAWMMKELKKNKYKRPSWIMQSRESAMFIGRIARRVMAERPEIPLITLHDSLCSTEPHMNYLESVAMDEFRQVNVVPKFEPEPWN